MIYSLIVSIFFLFLFFSFLYFLLFLFSAFYKFNFLSYYFTKLGTAGIAGATTMSSMVQTILLFIYIKRKYGFSLFKNLFSSIGTPLIASILLIPVIFGVEKIYSSVNVLMVSLFLRLFTIALIYLLIVLFLEPKYVKEFKNLLSKKAKK